MFTQQKILIALAGCILLFAHHASVSAAKPEAAPQIGIDENLGGQVPLDLEFVTEDGKVVTLAELVDGKPAVLSLVYFNCPGICSPLLAGMAEVIDDMDIAPGQDYAAITISFDPTETHELAREKKKNFMYILDRDMTDSSWHFLTGTQENIDKVTEAVGFKYEKRGNDFVHSASLFVLSPEGVIVRYLYGTQFLPFDLKMALTEASEGRIGRTINKLLLYCFSYDPDGRGYVLQTTRIAGTLILAMAALFVVFVGASAKRRSGGKGSN